MDIAAAIAQSQAMQREQLEDIVESEEVDEDAEGEEDPGGEGQQGEEEDGFPQPLRSRKGKERATGSKRRRF